MCTRRSSFAPGTRLKLLELANFNLNKSTHARITYAGGARCFITISCGLELLSLPFPLTFSTILIVKLSVQNRPHTYNKQTYRDHVHSPQIGKLKLHGTNRRRIRSGSSSILSTPIKDTNIRNPSTRVSEAILL